MAAELRRVLVGGIPALMLALAGQAFVQAAAAAESAEASRERQIKAAFLYNFAKYVEWPARSFAAADAPIVIGVYCAEPFGELLDRIVSRRRIGGRAVAIRTLKTPAESRQVHEVYVCSENRAMWGPITEALRGSPTLTVVETELAKEPRSVIAFIVEGDKVRFSIDMNEAGMAGLRISDQLQKLAVSVRKAPVPDR